MALSLRTALAAAGILAIVHTGGSVGVALCLGAVVSLPATLLAVGGYAAYVGVMLAVNSVALSSFGVLGLGLASTLAGWVILNSYNKWNIGIVDSYVIQPLTCAASHTVRSMF